MNPETFDLLVHKYFEGTISAPEGEELWAAVRSDPKAADRFVELSELESALAETLKADQELPTGVYSTLPKTPRSAHRHRSQLRRTSPWPFLAAATLFALAVTLFVRRDRNREESLLTKDSAPPSGVTPRGPEEAGAPEKSSATAPHLGPPVPPKPDGVAPENRALAAKPPTPEATPPSPPRPEGLPAKPEPPPQKPLPTGNEAPKPAPLPKNPSETAPTVAKHETAVLERLEGEVFQVGEAPGTRLVAAQALASGAGIETRGPRSLAVIRLEDGSHLELRGDTRLEKIQLGEGDHSVIVSRGVLAVSVPKPPDRKALVFRSPQAEAVGLGTRFVLQVTPEWTRLDVEEGRVPFRRNSDPAAIEVGPGYYAQAGKGPAPVARPIVVIRSFQDGVFPTADYAGTQDTAISSSTPTVNAGTLDQLRIHRQSGNDAQWAALLRWDLSGIPPKSKVVSAELSFWVTGGAPPPLGRIYEIRRPWKEQEATWRQASTGQFWQIQGAQAEEDRGRKLLGSINAVHGAMTTVPLGEAGVAVVQQWVTLPQTNSGIIVVKDPSEAWEIASRRWAAPEHRPKLSVTFVPLLK